MAKRDAPAPSADGGCPSCGSPLIRARRDGVDRWLGRFKPSRRYTCSSATCGWSGLVGVSAAAAAAGASRSRQTTIAVWAVVASAAALGIADLANRYLDGRAVTAAAPAQPAGIMLIAERSNPATTAPPGWHSDGDDLPDHDLRVLRNPSRLTLRKGCVWGVPGRNPYRGTVEQALAAARLPPEVVRQIAALVATGTMQDKVRITRDGIRTADGRRSFDHSKIAMGFGNTFCFDTAVNFAPGHVEYAAYFEAMDRQGRMHKVMVPAVCQNVSVLTENTSATPDDAGEVAGARAEVVDAPAETVASADAPGRRSPLGGPVPNEPELDNQRRQLAEGPGTVPNITITTVPQLSTTNEVVRQVPEPGTWTMVVPGLLFLAWLRRRR